MVELPTLKQSFAGFACSSGCSQSRFVKAGLACVSEERFMSQRRTLAGFNGHAVTRGDGLHKLSAEQVVRVVPGRDDGDVPDGSSGEYVSLAESPNTAVPDAAWP